ncbi:hypothetical protein EVAR_38360_1 [Eumeta japonica]|uniref:Uncharacterized protein n=1 Tax=Eumeta variegata TaxID=151549 RepID=A0A4C1XZA5_EUMVA|nr:hypothetical protein EVAR_38360_1 [Eumeta japonica]
MANVNKKQWKSHEVSKSDSRTERRMYRMWNKLYRVDVAPPHLSGCDTATGASVQCRRANWSRMWTRPVFARGRGRAVHSAPMPVENPIVVAESGKPRLRCHVEAVGAILTGRTPAGSPAPTSAPGSGRKRGSESGGG